MKKILILTLSIILLTLFSFSDVVKKTKSQVSFKKFGTYSTEQSETITAAKKRIDSNNQFKGKGLLGGAAKLFFKNGEFSAIVNLTEMKIYNLNHKKKVCQVSPLNKLSFSEERGDQQHGEENRGETDTSNIKVTRNEFMVKNTGEKKTINQFPSTKYLVSWNYEWKNLDTGEKGTNRLHSVVWATPNTGAIQRARKEEMQFFKNYMEKIGLNVDMLQQDILGTRWMNIFGSLSKDDSTARQQNDSQAARELAKIKGYPVVVDGKYFASREGGQEQEGESRNVRKMFGRLAKKALSKKSKGDSDTPDLTFYTEVLSVGPGSAPGTLFQIPNNYKIREAK